VVPPALWKQVLPDVPTCYLTCRGRQNSIINQRPLAAARSAGKEIVMRRWASLPKHGLVMRLRGAEHSYCRTILRSDVVPMPKPRYGLHRRERGRPTITIVSLAMAIRTQCMDLPVLEPMHRHGSAPARYAEAGIGSECLRCRQEAETLSHALSDCPAVSGALRMMRHRVQAALDEAGIELEDLLVSIPDDAAYIVPLALLLACAVFRASAPPTLQSAAFEAGCLFVSQVWAARNAELEARLRRPP